MKRFVCLLVFLALLAACAPAAQSPTPAPTIVKPTETPSLPPTAIVTPTASPVPNLDPCPGDSCQDAYAAARALGRGVNMGNALEAPREGEWGVYLQKHYFEAIKQAGFHSVRIPISWNAHAAEIAPYEIDPSFFERVDAVIGWALGSNLLVIVDFHNYPLLMSDPQGQTERYLAIWKQVAERYKDYPDSVLFELLNEPNGKLDSAAWNALAARALTLVRQSNPSRNVVIGGPIWNSYDNIKNLELPEADRHIIATFHYYNPFPFTHQGAEWAEGMDKYLGTTWLASDAEKAAVSAEFEQVSAWSAAHNRPVLLGEFGAYSKADMDSRARWTSFVAREAERRGFAWAYWEFCAGFGVYDPAARAWREPLLKALIP